MTEATPGGRADDGSTVGRTRLRLLVAALVAVEAALLMGGGLVLLADAVGVVGAFDDADGDRTTLVAMAVVALLVGGGLAFCARGVLRGAVWARGPVLTWQLLQAGVGMPVSASGAWWAGVPLLATAVVIGVLVAGRHVLPPRD